MPIGPCITKSIKDFNSLLGLYSLGLSNLEPQIRTTNTIDFLLFALLPRDLLSHPSYTISANWVNLLPTIFPLAKLSILILVDFHDVSVPDGLYCLYCLSITIVQLPI